MVFKWSDKNTLLFLETFKSYQCLWNHKLDEYKVRTIRANAMKSLISDLNLEVTEEDIKHKIKTIRTRFTTELTKIKQSTKSGCSSDDVYVPSLYWFKHAEFLTSVCIPRQSSSNLDRSIIQRDSQVTENENSDDSEHKFQDVSKLQTYSQKTNNERSFESKFNNSQAGNINIKKPNCENSSNASSEFVKPSYSGKPINRKRKNDTSTIDKAIKELKTISDEIKENNKEHEFDLFCKSLAVQLRRMPLNRALICQEQLQSVMTQERLFQLSEFGDNCAISSYSATGTPSPFGVDQSPASPPNDDYKQTPPESGDFFLV